MKGTRISVVIAALILLLIATACSAELAEDRSASVSFANSARSIVSKQEAFDKDQYYWKYAARKLLVLGQYNGERNDLSAQTPSYDEEGAEFIHEDEPGLDGKVDGFSEGNWDFLLFGYRRSGEEGNYTYSLVYRGEVKAVALMKDEENMVEVPVAPVSDHGNGSILVDTDHIYFAPAEGIDEGSAIEMSYTVRALSNGEEKTGEGGLFDLEPGLYRVDVKFTLNEYTFAHGAVIATVYSNLTTTVFGTVDELQTFADIDIPDAG